MKDLWVIGGSPQVEKWLQCDYSMSPTYNRRMQARAFLVCGQKPLEKILGHPLDRARVHYPGQRVKYRSRWECYVYEHGGKYFVAAPPAAALTGAKRGSSLPLLIAAVNRAQELAAGAHPMHPKVIQSPSEVSGWVGPFGLDFETFGDGSPARLGLASESGVLSCAWSSSARDLLQHLLPGAEVLAHNAPFDSALVEQHAGVSIDTRLWWDTMQAHRLLSPEQQYGLGYIAPLYACVAPWKHLAGEDQPWYNGMDAAILLPIQREQHRSLMKTGQLSLWERIERHVPWLGLPREWGKPYYSFTLEPGWFSLAEEFSGPLTEPPADELEIVEHRLRGFGPIQTKNSLGIPVKKIRAIWTDWLAENPQWTKFEDQLTRQVKKDGFILSPEGRRLCTRDGKKALHFLMLTTAQDRQLARKLEASR